ncbi:DNA sulfur modification protein DndD [Salisediminibacterium beveridgei]|nr:DNA sulfur modification protein DndD [Salisediminibacterium beveridgei]
MIDLYIPESSTSRSNPNIILIGGLNGAGKTTILKAIHFALFGKREMSSSDYERIFANVLNNQYASEGGREASVTLSLETDNYDTLEIKVIWQFDKNKKLIHEDRQIKYYKAGSNFATSQRVEDPKSYERMIDKLIPIHAAPFFIFDGEELKDIIIRQKRSGLKESIDRITGITMYNRYLNDLQQIQSNLQSDLSKTTSLRETERNQTRVNEIDNELKKISEDIKYYSDKKTIVYNKRQRTREEIDNKLKNNQNSRDELINERNIIESKITNIESDYIKNMIPHLPELLLADKIKILQERLYKEREYNKHILRRETSLEPYYKFMNQLFNEDISPPLTDVQKNKIKNLGEQIWLKDSSQNQEYPLEGPIRHQLSDQDINMIRNISFQNTEQFKTNIKNMKELQEQLITIKERIENAPGAQDISKEQAEAERLALLNRDLERKIKSIYSKKDKLDDEKRRLNRKITDAINKGSNASKLHDQYNSVTKLIAASDEFITKLREHKSETISSEFAQMLNTLFRKKDEFGDVFFDINDYQIKIHSSTGQLLSITDRSAGEMQMISSAFIWALTKASNLKLPMVIDTPLGRLDSYHRNELIHNYYKNLSDQVIILSTDTEITKEYIDFMKEHSYKQYLLEYNEEKKYTLVRADYFSFV